VGEISPLAGSRGLISEEPREWQDQRPSVKGKKENQFFRLPGARRNKRKEIQQGTTSLTHDLGSVSVLREWVIKGRGPDGSSRSLLVKETTVEEETRRKSRVRDVQRPGKPALGW